MDEMADFLEMLARHAAEDNERRVPAVSHVGQIARLHEFKARLDAGNPFKVGDLVTPRADSPVYHKAAPHLVVETRNAQPDFSGSPGSVSHGAKFDLRIVNLRIVNFHPDGELAMHWVESVYFELYVAAIHERADHERACGEA